MNTKEIKEFRKKWSTPKRFEGTYILQNIKSDKYWLSNKYKKLFKWLNKDSIFTECYEEDMRREGNDIIIKTTWKGEGEVPKGIIEL